MGAPPEKPPSSSLQKALLKTVFSDAKNNGEVVWPDVGLVRALERFRDAVKILAPDTTEISEKGKRAAIRPSKSTIADQRALHHLAVDEFYKTYHAEAAKRGRPTLPEQHRLEAQQLRKQGRSWPGIAKELGDPGDAKAGGEKMRKRAAKPKKPRQ